MSQDDKIVLLPVPDIPPELSDFVERLKRDIELVCGVPPQYFGAARADKEGTGK